MERVHKFTLDISKGINNTSIEVVTQDYASHKFDITLVEDEYKPFNLEDTIVRLIVLKPDGHTVQQDCTIVDNQGKVSVLLQLDTINIAGTCKAEIQVWDNAVANKRLTSAQFGFKVRKSLQDEETVVSTDEFSMLQAALEQAQNIDEKIAGKADQEEVTLLNDRLGNTETDVENLENNLTLHKTEFESFITSNHDAKNSIYRGKYLGNTVTATQYAAISSGTFTDMYIGDYWTIGGINWRIAAFNYYRNTGDSNAPGNHITLVPDTQLYSHVMNDTNITDGGYIGSKMYIEGLEQAKTTIQTIFSGHVLNHRQLLCNATVDGKASGWAWFDSSVELMNEIMVYGSSVFGAGNLGGGTGHNIGIGKSQLPLFALNPRMINTRQSYWLRDVVSAASFAFASSHGLASYLGASTSYGVRPAFSIS